jgi:beta-glucanase (GH16 family)
MGIRTRFDSRILGAASLLAVLPLATGCAQAQGEGLQLCRYKKVFSEDFNSLSVSPSNNERTTWSAHTPWFGDFGDARFIDPVTIYADPEKNDPFFVKDGILTIRARKHENGQWTSGLLSTADPKQAGFALRYGYFEARMKLPPGPGTWPAFWLAANKAKDDKDPAVEIDIVEYYGKFTDGFHSVLHVWDAVDPKKTRSEDHVTRVPAGSLVDDFHTYGAEVTKDWIVYYLDRHEIARMKTPAEHTKPLMMLVNLALGSGWPIDKTPNPSDLLVDYVHAFAPDEAKRDEVCK